MTSLSVSFTSSLIWLIIPHCCQASFLLIEIGFREPDGMAGKTAVVSRAGHLFYYHSHSLTLGCLVTSEFYGSSGCRTLILFTWLLLPNIPPKFSSFRFFSNLIRSSSRPVRNWSFNYYDMAKPSVNSSTRLFGNGEIITYP